MTFPVSEPDRSRRRAPVATDLYVGQRLGIYTRASVLSRKVKDKSVDDQDAAGVAWGVAQKCDIVENYIDNDRSASRYATRDREDFERARNDVKSGRIQMLWFWDLSRATRELETFASFRNLCRKHGVWWVIRDRVFDLNNATDAESLGQTAVSNEAMIEHLRASVVRGIGASAEAGKPHGKAPYGFRRSYHPVTRDLVDQVPDDTVYETIHVVTGEPVRWSPIGIVEQIFAEIVAGTSLRDIAQWLNDNGVYCPLYLNAVQAGNTERMERWRNTRWLEGGVRQLANNVSYLGIRRYAPLLPGSRKKPRLPEFEVKGVWPSAVDEDEFYGAASMLHKNGPRPTRPSQARYLLTCLALCAGTRKDGQDCGEQLVAVRGRSYQCRDGHSSYLMSLFDPYVVGELLHWVGQPDNAAAIWAHAGVTDRDRELRGELAKKQAELLDWQRQLDDGGSTLSPGDFAQRKAALQAVILDLETQMKRARVPISLRTILAATDPDQRIKVWHGMSLANQRDCIRALMTVHLTPVGKGRVHHPASSRVVLRYLYDADTRAKAAA